MQFNITALDGFRKANLQGEKAIANVGENNTITQKNSYYGGIGRIFRKSATEAANNAARTELLKSLGNAFGLEGISENKNGVTTFSKGFMTRLEQLLGKDFKRGDFEIGPDGTVSSGKPLTQRRIAAIINRAEIAAGIKFDAKAYKAKLALVNAEVAKLPDGYQKDKLTSYFAHVAKCIDFLDKDLDKMIIKNEDWRPGFEDDIPLCFFKNPKTGKMSDMMVRAPLVNYLSENIGLFHFEQYKNIPQKLNSPEDLKANMDYIRNTTKLYVQEAIDLFLDAKGAGKLPELTKLICKEPGACMDAKASQPGAFRVDLGLLAPDVNMEEIDLVADHGPDTNLDKCIYEEIRVANAQTKGAKGWADLAKAVKKELVGQIRPIMTLDEHNKIVPLKKDGQQVVRAVTAADIDKIGPVCTNILGIFD